MTNSFARRCTRSVALTAAALVVAASGVGFSQDDTSQDTDQDRQQARRLPNYYARVVSDDQRQQIYEIQDKHSPQIDELQKQLDEAVAARDKEIEGVLTEEQIARVKEYEEEAQQRRAARRGRRGRNSGGGDAGGNTGGGNSGGGGE